MAYHSVRQVADKLNVNPSLVRSLIRQGKLEAIKVGSIFRIEEEVLTDYIKRETIHGPEPTKPLPGQHPLPYFADTCGEAVDPGDTDSRAAIP